MITIISGTNRANSNSIRVAKYYKSKIEQKGHQVHLIDLAHLPKDFIHADMYASDTRSDVFVRQIMHPILRPTTKYIFVVPEYNGGIPGIFKLFIDGCDIAQSFYHKKVCLVGIASGRAGNLRGIDHLTNMLHYIKMDVFYNKLPISSFENQIDGQGKWNSPDMIRDIDNQVNTFLDY